MKFATAEQRLLKLEQSNRRLKAVMFALCTMAVGVGVLGAADTASKTIRAERFVLVDASGKERAELSASGNASALQFFNPDGSRALVLLAGGAGNGVFISNSEGKDRLSMFASADKSATLSLTKEGSQKDAVVLTDKAAGTVLEFRDDGGRDRVDLGYTPKGASLVVADANDTVRSVVAEQGVTTYLKGGQIEWASFGENLSPEERKRVMDIVNTATPP